MKKRLIFICASVLILVLVMIFVFNSANKKEDLKSIYLRVLNDNKTFILNDKKTTMKEILGNDDYFVNYYSFVDYGNDNHLEFYISIYGRNTRSIIFNYIDNKVYAYELEEFVTFNTVDGYSSFNSDNSSGWVKYTFKGKKLNKEFLILEETKEKKCSVDNKDFDCSKIVDEEIKLLDKIGEKAEEISVPNNREHLISE